MGSIPIRATWPSGGTGRHTTLRTSRLQRHGSSTLPLVTAEWTGVWFPARSHKPFDAGSNPASATWTAEYANLVKRPGREPGESLWVRFPPRLLFDPVVQRQRLLAHIQATIVRVHPGSLGLQVLRRHASVVRREAGFKSRADLSEEWAAGPTGRHRLRTPEMRVQVPRGPLMTQGVGKR